MLVPRGAHSAFPARTIIETVGVGILAERPVRLLGHLGQNVVVILSNVVLLDPVIRESVTLQKGINMAT